MKVTKLREIEAALSPPSPDIRLYLLHGPDASAAQELATRLGAAVGADAERVDLDGAMLRGDPARLVDEAASLSLFGGARFIRVSNAGEESADAFAALLAAEQAGNPVVALAPTVRSTAKIVKLAIDSPRAMAFACYEPSLADLERVAVSIARDQGLRPVGGVARRLVGASGGDRAVIAREVEKLALYLDAAPDRPHDLDDAALDALGADLGDAEMTRLVDSVVDARTADLGDELARLEEANVSPIPWLRQLVRRLLVLAEMRADVDRGEAVGTVLKRHRIFFREEESYARALRRWSAPMLARAIDRVREAERGVMASGTAGHVLAGRTLVEITRALERRG